MADGLLFNRFYKVVIGYGDKEVFDVTGLRMRFDIQKYRYQTGNWCKLTIYNLNLREHDIKGTAIKRNGKWDYGTVALYAGYAESNGLLFRGQIKNVYSKRDGTDVVTELYCVDAAKATENAYMNRTFPAGASLEEQLNAAYRSFRAADNSLSSKFFKISTAIAKNNVGSRSILTDTRTFLNDLGREYNFEWSIQNNEFTVTGEDDTLLPANRAQVITKTTGMIGAPALTEKGVLVKNLLLWDMVPGIPFRIESELGTVKLGVNLYFDQTYRSIGEGYYKAYTVRHIGDTRGNKWETHIDGRKMNNTGA